MNKTRTIFLCLATWSLVTFSGCKKEEEVTAAIETGTLADRDGNVYKTVKIGSQWWMAENLKVKTYRNGDLISFGETNQQWMDTLAYYCVYYANDDAPGLLYNGYAVSDSRGIAPEGWHIPSDKEWKQLEQSVGMSASDADKASWRGTHEGEKLKIESPLGWTRYGDIWATNESGFTALAGGSRMFDGTWGDPGLFSNGFWWTSTSYPENKAWYRYMDYKNANIFRSHASKMYGFSVRCVKD